ncbi:MAG: hypothetical protein HYR75_04250 [Gemmatimonadetes bacterium]|nr:hypothetical protein [Gemmatimonadota bacterium]
MSDERRKQVEHIQALLSERRKIERWLQGLESRRGDAPSHVVARVEADYRSKLAESQARLSSETGAVRALVSDLESALATQERAVTAKADERAESELRAAVGEFGAKAWDKLKATLDAAVAALEEERDATRRELETMRALLDDAAPGDAAGQRSATATEAAAFTAPESAPPRAEAEEKLADAAESHAEPAADAMPPAETTSAAASSSAVPVAGTASHVPDAAPTVDELAFLRTVLGGSTPPDAQHATVGASSGARPVTRPSGVRATSAGTSKADAPQLFPTPDAPMPVNEDMARESGGFQRLSGQFGQLGDPTPRSSEAVKSLKCSECGTLNYPTEWYCERCGGELAAF